MSVDLHYQYYPVECIHPRVLPYLNMELDLWCDGNRMPEGFYMTCDQYGDWDEQNDCWIFMEANKLFEFARRAEVPDVIASYITVYYNSDEVFILWKR